MQSSEPELSAGWCSGPGAVRLPAHTHTHAHDMSVERTRVVSFVSMHEFLAVMNRLSSCLFKKPSSFAKPLARIEKGRLLIVDKCQEKWCKIKSDDYEGWIKTNDIWGLIN